LTKVLVQHTPRLTSLTDQPTAMKDLLDDFPLPEANHLLFAGAALAGAAGVATVLKPQKMHEAYFSATAEEDAPTPFHKPSTRWLGLSLCWVGGLNLAAGLADSKSKKTKRNLLIANGAGLLAGTQKQRPTQPRRANKRR
jgi:hypothetical protein